MKVVKTNVRVDINTVHTRKLVELTETPGRLEIKLTVEGTAQIPTMKKILEKDGEKKLWETLLFYHKPKYAMIEPKLVGALTDAPIIEKPSSGGLWWFPEYQVIDPVDRLFKMKEVVFTGQ